MVVIYEDEGTTMYFCMNDCVCHSEPARRKNGEEKEPGEGRLVRGVGVGRTVLPRVDSALMTASHV